MNDTEELAAQWRGAGLEVTGPEGLDYGKREGWHVDPDGNKIRFASGATRLTPLSGYRKRTSKRESGRISLRKSRKLYVLLLLTIGLGSAFVFIAINETIDGKPSDYPSDGWVAVVEPFSEQTSDEISLEEDSQTSIFVNKGGGVFYTVSACGSHPFKGDLILGGAARISDGWELYTGPQYEKNPSMEHLTDLYFNSALDIQDYDVGPVEVVQINFSSPPPCPTSTEDLPGGQSLTLVGTSEGAIEHAWTAFGGLWEGPNKSLSWPLIGTFPSAVPGELGPFESGGGLTGTWSLPTVEYIKVESTNFPLNDSIDNSQPAVTSTTTDQSSLQWQSSNPISPSTTITDENYLSNLQTGIAICTILFGIAGSWLASLTFEWFRRPTEAEEAGQGASKNQVGKDSPSSCQSTGPGNLNFHPLYIFIVLYIIARKIRRHA